MKLIKLYGRIKNLYLKKIVGGGFSLDIGCGNAPRGDVNCDLQIPNSIPQFFVRCDVHQLPFKAKCFGIAFESGVLPYCKDKSKVLDEMHRVAKRVILSEPIRTWMLHRRHRKHWFTLRQILNLGEIIGFIGIPFISGTLVVEHKRGGRQGDQKEVSDRIIAASAHGG